ncbi:hypothetical protein QJQ45_022756 [Haematococcus lacustris]|nr:hypothetical protein QJQ45_022756 [Haematococcus lacustris]
MDLWKVELLVGSGCKGAVRNLTVAGRPMSASYDLVTSQGSRYLVMKASQLGPLWPPAAAEGTRLCLTLDSSSRCPDLASFCLGFDRASGCRYALSNQARTCCPSADTGVTPEIE